MRILTLSEWESEGVIVKERKMSNIREVIYGFASELVSTIDLDDDAIKELGSMFIECLEDNILLIGTRGE